jgi:hypothetical protein
VAVASYPGWRVAVAADQLTVQPDRALARASLKREIQGPARTAALSEPASEKPGGRQATAWV